MENAEAEEDAIMDTFFPGILEASDALERLMRAGEEAVTAIEKIERGDSSPQVIREAKRASRDFDDAGKEFDTLINA